MKTRYIGGRLAHFLAGVNELVHENEFDLFSKGLGKAHPENIVLTLGLSGSDFDTIYEAKRLKRVEHAMRIWRGIWLLPKPSAAL